MGVTGYTLPIIAGGSAWYLRRNAMYTITSKERLTDKVIRLDILAPLVARKAQAGQFVILRAKENSKRIPLTVAGQDPEKGTVTVICQIVGAGTMELDTLNEGDSLQDFVGHWAGPASWTASKGMRGRRRVGYRVLIAKKLHEMGATVHSVVGFSKDLVIWKRVWGYQRCAARDDR